MAKHFILGASASDVSNIRRILSVVTEKKILKIAELKCMITCFIWINVATKVTKI